MSNKGNKPQTNTQKVQRTNTGNRGARRRKMNPSDLVLLGKGQYQTIKPVSGPAWLGASGIRAPFDAKQAEINYKNGWC